MIEKLNRLDRRFIYLALLVLVAAGLIFDVKLPVVVSSQVKAAYQALETAPVDKLCIVEGQWANGTRGENRPQTKALLRHLMRRRIKFAIIGFDAQGPDNTNKIAMELATEVSPPYKYGVDWVNWGYRNENAVEAFLKSMVRDIPGAVKVDYNNTKITDFNKLPIMKNIHDMRDVGLFIDITPSSTLEKWIAFVQGVNNTPTVYSCTAVMAPEGYQFLDSGQIVGMLTGIKGAIEYEDLIHTRDSASRQAMALSITHVMIIVLIVLGNIGFVAEKRKRARQGGYR